MTRRKAMIVVFLLATWVGLGELGAGLELASLRKDFPSNYQNKSWAKKRQGNLILMGAIMGPLSALVAFFDSGFAQDGWLAQTTPRTLTGEPIDLEDLRK